LIDCAAPASTWEAELHLQDRCVNSFLDEATIYVQAGDGGGGSMHFHREKFVPFGGPDGGDGGTGGDVILRADRELNTLFSFKRRRRFVADSGQPGGQNKMRGRAGDDLMVPVPVGTVVRDAETGETIADLVREDQMVVVARGGKGGLGNVHFKTSTNQAPHFAEKGEPGESRTLDLELKVIADVGIVGLPNAGKSTLLSVISAARPKIADYPFTTLTPNLGVVDVDETSQPFVVADIPGLIEGAHEGIGLGHEFLRHIERTLVLIHLVDGSSDDPLDAFRQINDELGQYAASLTDKPQIVAVNKMDIPEAQERWPELQRTLKDMGYEVLPVSAVTREGVDALIYRTAQVLAEQEREIEEAPHEIEVITVKPPPDHFEIERKRATFHVHGETVERLAVMTDMENEEAVHRLQTRLKRMGLFAALERAGAREGSKVRIGDTEFTWDTTYEPEVKPANRKGPARPRSRP
jgi:GTP-binding protein